MVGVGGGDSSPTPDGDEGGEGGEEKAEEGEAKAGAAEAKDADAEPAATAAPAPAPSTDGVGEGGAAADSAALATLANVKDVLDRNGSLFRVYGQALGKYEVVMNNVGEAKEVKAFADFLDKAKVSQSMCQ